MLRVFVALVFIVGAGVLGYLSWTQDDFCLICGMHADSSSLHSNSIQSLIIKDLKLAEKAKELPETWSQISEVKYLYHSKKIQKSLDKSPIVGINKKGSKRLLVEFFDEPESEDMVIVRYNIVDVASGNTVGEINRRLKLPTPPSTAVQKGVVKPAPMTPPKK
ncbi:MAG: hypothetical protein B7Y39_16155 [Bdellovibrio sp. 28-41-41]|nr:MAG: hypothetical protein B7Y39_16155 [Bdellovibrio sp. 28-41-41]